MNESNNKIKLTIKGKKDGFGAQYQAIMSGIAWCEYNKYKYIHTPINKLQHNTNILNANKFIGIYNDNIDNIDNLSIIKPYIKEIHYSNNPSKYYTPDVLSKIRNYYNSSEKPDISNIDIAFHIRRGDVNNKKNIQYYTSNKDNFKIIDKLKNEYSDMKIHIFSNGNINEFQEFINIENIKLHLNEDIFYTFHSLVKAKILVMAKSSLSYSAALLNENKIYYQKFWHKKLDHWINI